MSKVDKSISVVILGLIAPVVLLLTFWWGSIPFVPDRIIPYFAISGLVLGVILDVTLLRKFIFTLFTLPLYALITIEIFYSIMIYGFFMGLPVANSFVGILGAYIIAKSCIFKRNSQAEAKKSIHYNIIVSAVILCILCIFSAILALNESSICSQIKGMLNLPFDVTIQMVWLIIIVGGSLLITFQYYFSKLVSRKACKPIMF